MFKLCKLRYKRQPAGWLKAFFSQSAQQFFGKGNIIDLYHRERHPDIVNLMSTFPDEKRNWFRALNRKFCLFLATSHQQHCCWLIILSSASRKTMPPPLPWRGVVFSWKLSEIKHLMCGCAGASLRNMRILRNEFNPKRQEREKNMAEPDFIITSEARRFPFIFISLSPHPISIVSLDTAQASSGSWSFRSKKTRAKFFALARFPLLDFLLFFFVRRLFRFSRSGIRWGRRRMRGKS